jgi:hypothetical protein
VEWLAGDYGAAERALRDGYDVLGGLGELGYRASVGALLARVLHVQGRGTDAAFFAHVSRESASDRDIWSQVLSRLTQARVLADGDRPAEAEALAREALGIVESTDLLELRAYALLDLGEVHRAGGRHSDAQSCAEAAYDLYLRKGNEVAAERARALLARAATSA